MTGEPQTRVRVLETGPRRIRVTARHPTRTPAEAFRDWTDAERLVRWWPPEATVDPRAGGAYELRWPRMNWHLRGRYLDVVAGDRLRFTWTWDHEPGVTKEVDVRFRMVDAGGTEAEVQQGPYDDTPRDVELRQEHLDGWTHFLARWVTDPGR